MRRQRTYWHLDGQGKKPSEYELVTSRLLYQQGGGFEVQTPIAAWYREHRDRSPLVCSDWERFRDPRETTYASYCELQRRQETYLDGVLATAERSDHDRRMTPAWLAVLARGLGPLRYPLHGLQLVTAYVGSMAPGGRVVVACLFQAADQLRAVQRLAYRLAQLRATHAGFGADSKQIWQEHPAWQPTRALIERLLVTWDWGEALLGLDLVVKPALDALWLDELARVAASAGDEVLARVLQSLHDDARWQRAWSRALVTTAISDQPGQRAALRAWLARWRPPTEAAVAAAAPLFAEAGEVAGIQARVATILDEQAAALDSGGP